MDLNLIVLAGRLAAPPETASFDSGASFVRYLVTIRSDEASPPRRRSSGYTLEPQPSPGRHGPGSRRPVIHCRECATPILGRAIEPPQPARDRCSFSRSSGRRSRQGSR